jgi:hypothetical protein
MDFRSAYLPWTVQLSKSVLYFGQQKNHDDRPYKYKVSVKEETDNDQGDPVDLGSSVLTRLAKIKSKYALFESSLLGADLWSFLQPVDLAPLGLQPARQLRSIRSTSLEFGADQ